MLKREKGIYRRLRDGALVVRAQKTDPKTGKPKDSSWIVKRPDGTSDRDYLQLARDSLMELRGDIDRTGRATSDPHQKFAEYAEKQIQGRIDRGTVDSLATEKRYKGELKVLVAKWGESYVDMITREDVLDWVGELGQFVKSDKYKPNYVNGWWRTFKGIMADFAVSFRLANPCERVAAISNDLGDHTTYTDEETNSLEPDELRPFFEAARIWAPQYYALLLLGTITGRRACELRPLRSSGVETDLNWNTGKLLVRRSQTYGPARNKLKQGKRFVLAYLNPELLDILRWHRDRMEGNRAESDLLFPPLYTKAWRGEASGFMARSALAKILPMLCEKAGIEKHLTPRFMRRTYQDWCRAANVGNDIQKAMSGHATDKMKEWYSTLGETEGRKALASMCKIAGIASARRPVIAMAA